MSGPVIWGAIILGLGEECDDEGSAERQGAGRPPAARADVRAFGFVPLTPGRAQRPGPRFALELLKVQKVVAQLVSCGSDLPRGRRSGANPVKSAARSVGSRDR